MGENWTAAREIPIARTNGNIYMKCTLIWENYNEIKLGGKMTGQQRYTNINLFGQHLRERNSRHFYF